MKKKNSSLKEFEWLIDKTDASTEFKTPKYKPEYENVTKFNTERTIIDNVDPKTLNALSDDIMELLDTSIAVYEKNGDYAFGRFDSTWCRLMDSSSFKLCNTKDAKEALNCGKWLCHENCWHDSAKQAMKTGKPTDIECVGGIHLYGEPIRAEGKVIGCINMGYGNPPQDDKTLAELAEKYHIDKKEILKRAKEYKPRPAFIIENAKKRLKSVALLIGQIVENSNAKKKLQKSEELLNATGSMAKVGGWEINLEDNTVEWTKATRQIHEVPDDYIPTLEEAINFFPGESKNKIENAVQQAIEKGVPYNMVVPFKTAKGKKLWTQTNGKPVHKDGKCVRLNGTFQDITDQYNAELKLKEQQLVFKRTEEIAHVGSWEWDIATDKVTWSDELFRIFKQDPKKGAVSYADHPKVYTPESMKKLDEVVQKAIEKGESYDLDVDIVRPDGEIRHCVARGYAKKDVKGKVVKLYGSFQDITQRKQIENAIKQKELESSEMLDKMLNAFVLFESVFDENGQFISYRFLSINKAYEEITGVKNEEVKGKTVHDVWPETEPEWIKRYGEVAVSGKSQEFELYHDPTKKLYHCQVYRPFNTKQKFCVIFEDITDKKQAEQELKQLNEELAAQNEEYVSVNEELQQTVSELEITKENIRESEERFKALHNASFGGITIHDKGIILECNQGLSKITGYTYDELIGMDGLLLIAEETREKVMNNILAEYEEPYEALGQRKNGEIYPVRLEARMIPYKGKRVRVVEFRDITLQKKHELTIQKINEELTTQNEEYENLNEELRQTVEELQRAKDKAEESDRLKSAFLANMSHEIRTPMNGILGFTDLLKKPNLNNEKQQKYISVIQQSGNRMLETINDIVEISKIETGDIAPIKDNININEQLEYLYEFFKPEADKKEIELNYKTDLSHQKSSFTTDKSMFNSILTNLIKNAIKFTETGSIEFGYSLQSKGEIKFYVKDTGMGIPKSKQDVIFDRFMQADLSDSRAKQGSGLGLAITKAYIEILGGKIWLESEEEKGSTFYFKLPYSNHQASKPENKNNQKIEPTRGTKKLKILIVEDDETSDMHLSILTEHIAQEILHVKDGKNAVELCKKRDDFDLILMDIKLPGLNGYIATEEIRKFNKDVIIIAETAYAMKGDREKALEAGCNDYITKPIDSQELQHVISKYFK
ncbi:MAG: PAS domain S-box protein [Bacteroidetes bacterium]|nr:PAS domain S-box protein [Bacteroidota bacterium]